MLVLSCCFLWGAVTIIVGLPHPPLASFPLSHRIGRDVCQPGFDEGQWSHERVPSSRANAPVTTSIPNLWAPRPPRPPRFRTLEPLLASGGFHIAPSTVKLALAAPSGPDWKRKRSLRTLRFGPLRHDNRSLSLPWALRNSALGLMLSPPSTTRGWSTTRQQPTHSGPHPFSGRRLCGVAPLAPCRFSHPRDLRRADCTLSHHRRSQNLSARYLPLGDRGGPSRSRCVMAPVSRNPHRRSCPKENKVH